MLVNMTQHAFKPVFITQDVLHNLHAIGVPAKIATNYKLIVRFNLPGKKTRSTT